jgi:signal transduction histidine kinase
MKNRSIQGPRGILWFGWISVGIVLCTIIVWLLLLRESSMERIDQTLCYEVQEIGAVLKVLVMHNTPPNMITNDILSPSFSDQRKVYMEVRNTQNGYYVRRDLSDTTISLYARGCSFVQQPITVNLRDNALYRAYGQTFNGFSVCAAAPLPTFWNILTDSFSEHAIILPSLTVILGIIGIWSFVRLHQPIQRLDKYLQVLIQQPLGKELLKPPLPPKGDVYQLTQTVSKIVERLHASRNQALQFSSFASHELRTPLSIIRNQLELALASQTKAKELRTVVASAYDEMLRLNRAVEDLLSLATMQAGTLTLNLEMISLSNFLNHFYDEALFLTRPKDITVVLKKGPEVYIQGDMIRLRQVFFNLLDNAIKNISSGKRIRLSYTIKDNTVAIVFADTGIGIAPDKLEKIFEPFFKGAQRNGSPQGAGLGLAIVKWIIELHRGSITVSSEIGKGTEFVISLPYERVMEKR